MENQPNAEQPTGKLTPTGKEIKVSMPGCLKIL